MNQKEFEGLSKKEVNSLNSGDESAEQAWRAGYIYAQQQIKKLRESNFMDAYLDKLDDFCDQNLDSFKGWQLT